MNRTAMQFTYCYKLPLLFRKIAAGAYFALDGLQADLNAL